MLNAYTSHDLVAFHITARAERALEAADLLTDFVARPRIDADELDRERGVVVQEIARSEDQPAVMAEHLIDEAVFGDHPLGRPVLGPAEHIRETFTREGIVAFRTRRWSPSRGAAFAVGNLDSLGDAAQLDELFNRFEARPAPEAYDRAPALKPVVMVRERDSNQSHLRLSYRPADRRHAPARAGCAGHLLDPAGRVDGLAPVRRDPRAARAGLLRERLPPRVRGCARAAALGRPRVGQMRRGLPADAGHRQRAAARRAN